MSGGSDRWIGWTTTGCVGLLALIAGTVSYLHMHMLVEVHGQPGWAAALTPFSVDGMIVAASTTLLADSRSGSRGGFLPWALLVTGSLASLAANVAVAELTATGRMIAAWPSFALIAAYELLMRQVRRSADAGRSPRLQSQARRPATTGVRESDAVSRAEQVRFQTAMPGAEVVMSCGCGRGSGRRRTDPGTDLCPRAWRSAGNMAGMNAGVGSSSGLPWLEN